MFGSIRELQSWPTFSGTYENCVCSVRFCSGYLQPATISLVVLSWRILGNSPPLPLLQAMLIDNEIIRTVHKHSNMTILHGGGGGDVCRVEF